MALGHSPTVITTGLVFYYDIANIQKSWKGAPTTNVVAGDFDTTFESLADGDTAGFINQLGTGNYIGVTSSIGYKSFKSLKINNGSGGTARVYRTFPVLLGEYSAVSAWVYSLVAGPFLTIEYAGGDYNWGVSQTRNTHTGTGWEILWVRTDSTATSNTTGYYFLYPGNNNKDTYWDYIQVEKQQYPTPFVAGTRTNNQSIVDLTNNNTITANSLTYNADNSFKFNGTSNYLNCGSNSAINLTTAISIEAWFNAEATGGGIVTYGTTLAEQYALWATENKILFSTSWPSPWQLAYSNIISLNTWYHVVATFNNGNWKIYINGLLNTSGTFAITTLPAASGGYLLIGNNHPGGQEYFKGQIPVVKIYNRELSAAEVKQNFSALRGRYGL